MGDTNGSGNLKTAYDQLCTSYRAIDDFRAKLLGFLPLVSGGGLILLAGEATNGDPEFQDTYFVPAGLFGIAITTGLLAYELFGIKKCHALLVAGAALEEKMDLPPLGKDGKPAGQFAARPPHLLKVINEPFAAAAIYPAVLAAWTYLALFDNPDRAKISAVIFVVGFVGILVYDQYLKRKPKDESKGESKDERSQQPQPPAEADAPAATPQAPVT